MSKLVHTHQSPWQVYATSLCLSIAWSSSNVHGIGACSGPFGESGTTVPLGHGMAMWRAAVHGARHWLIERARTGALPGVRGAVVATWWHGSSESGENSGGRVSADTLSVRLLCYFFGYYGASTTNFVNNDVNNTI